MKKSMKKIAALLLSACILFCALPMALTAAEVENVESVGAYSSTFDFNGSLAEAEKDFAFYHDTTSSSNNSLARLTSADTLSSYVTVANNRLERIFNSATEKDASKDGNRPYWCMMYYTYKNQTFKNFTLTVDAYLPYAGSSYNGITVGSMGGGFKSNGGFTLGFQNYGGNKFHVFLGTAAQAKADFDDWFIHESVAGAKVIIDTAADKKYTITLTVQDGLADVSINDTAVFTDRNIGDVTGYLSLCNGIATGSYYDNLTITSLDESTYVRTETPGSYSNNFDVRGMTHLLEEDFAFYHDTTSSKNNSLSLLTTADTLSSYVTTSGNAVGRLFNSTTEKQPWNSGNFPYWCMMYYTYKNQTFKNFTLTVDAYLPAWGSSYNAITLGTMGGGFKSNGGYTLGMYYNSGGTLGLYLGKASEVKSYFDDWFIHDSANGHTTTTTKTADNKYKIVITVKDGLADVTINDVLVYDDRDIGAVTGYVSLCHGLCDSASGNISTYDNFSITSLDESTYSRTEAEGEYSNNFDVNGLNGILTEDFNFYHDTTASTLNTLSLLNGTDALNTYFTSGNNRLERIFDLNTEKQPWNSGNVPYWCMTYYTYKNQTFKDFTLTVDAYMPTWGSNYNAIAVGELGRGFKNNSGYTLGFYNDGSGNLDVFLGTHSQVWNAFDDWYIHDLAGHTASIVRTEDLMYKIKFTVTNGYATVNINGSDILSNVYVGAIQGYVSLCNGICTGSYYDNLTITRNDNVVYAGADGTIASISANTLKSIDEVGFDVGFASNGETLTENASTSYFNADTVGLNPYLAVNSGVYYTDFNNDTAIDNDDLTLLRKALIGTTALNGFMDLTADEDTDIRDLVRFKKALADEAIDTVSNPARYNYSFCLSDILAKADDSSDITLTPYIVVNGEKINGSAVTLKAENGAFAETVSETPTALYLGDSISYGDKDDNRGTAWCGRITENYGIQGKNISVCGWYLASVGQPTIVSEYQSAHPAGYDYVIIQGGVNDMWSGKPELGTVSPVGTKHFDVTTVAGALENTFATTKELAPDAKIGFIINFYPQVMGEAKWDSFVELAKAVCEKWDVPYIDLDANAEFAAEFDISTHTPDNVHPNATGYDIIYKYIGDWMLTL